MISRTYNPVTRTVCDHCFREFATVVTFSTLEIGEYCLCRECLVQGLETATGYTLHRMLRQWDTASAVGREIRKERKLRGE